MGGRDMEQMGNLYLLIIFAVTLKMLQKIKFIIFKSLTRKRERVLSLNSAVQGGAGGKKGVGFLYEQISGTRSGPPFKKPRKLTKLGNIVSHY